jgi:succinate-semialdehyde dehydrogenase/glutarate-semialdehyde dehydrogenase
MTASPAPSAAAVPGVAATGLPVHHSIVDGADVPGRAGLRSAIDPRNGEPFALASVLDAEQARAALDAARRAFPAWSAASFAERGRVLLRVRDALVRQADEAARLIEREQGKPAVEAHAAEVLPCLEALKHLARHAEELLREDLLESQLVLLAHKECRLAYAPIGVVLVISPWNYPLGIPLIGVATALAAGNTVVLKPAPAATLVGLRIGALFREAGLPAGGLNVLAVEDAVAAELVEDPRVGKIVFTGSTATGRKVMAGAAKNVTPVVLELGGKDPAVVCRDADLDRASKGIVWGAFMNAGQTCASVERVYVEEPVADAFVAKVVEETRRLRYGYGPSGEVDVGPLTLERQRRVVEEHVADALAKGAKTLTGGARPEGPGFHYPPTVLVDVDHSMRVMREETFGPLLAIMRVPDLDEAVRLANDSEYGLTASAWTRSPERARQLQERLAAGVVSVNDCLSSFGEPTAPWGGVKASGIGRSHGLLGLREMVQPKYVSRDRPGGELLWWYPYDGDLARIMKAAPRALHARSLASRVAANLGLLRVRRFLARVRIVDMLLNLDRLF